MDMKLAEEYLTEDFYCIRARFDRLGKLYTYKVHNSIKLEVDDLAIIHSDHYAVVEVANIGGIEMLDPNATWEYKYIVQKLDTTLYEALKDRSVRIKATLIQLKQKQTKRDVFAEYTVGLSEDDKKLLDTTLSLPNAD